MKVLLFGPYPPPHGGVQTHLVALRDFLQRRNIECGVVNLTRFRQADATTSTTRGPRGSYSDSSFGFDTTSSTFTLAAISRFGSSA